MIFSAAHVSNLRAFHDAEQISHFFLPAGTTKRSEPSQRFPSTCFVREYPSMISRVCRCRHAMTGAAEHCILCWEAWHMAHGPMADGHLVGRCW